MWGIFAVNAASAFSAPAGILSGPSALTLLICLMAMLISSVVGEPTSIGRSVGSASPLCGFSGAGRFKSSLNSYYNSNNSEHYIGVAMEPVMEKLDIHLTSQAFEDYFESLEIRALTKEDDEDVNIEAHFLTFIGKEAYSLLKTLALPEKPTSLSYTALKDLLLDYVQYTNSECR
ncbi:unnamed protein product [Schistosoma mattheei]|uniref:Uncharacterized protein n=1 Tax=Schistosoma mattheei TaxID=31246 RepID=A0A183P6C2_9TREM|nr:unnamed protein product [Schistosoma mattheei]